MNKIILHRNYGSPYCQKIMTMLGYCQLDWYSELTSKGVPRPVQETLSGNYSRRVPILQIGADIYCDTKEICHQIAEISGDKSLIYYHLTKNQKLFADELEYEFGKAVVAKLTPIELITSYFKHIPMKDACDFLIDRFKLKLEVKGNNSIEEKSNEEWTNILIQYLKNIDEKLEYNTFLSESETPNYTDFTAYTHVWYSNRVNKLKYGKGLSNIKKWLKKMNQFDMANYKELPRKEALKNAYKTEPKSIGSSYLKTSKINKQVSIIVNDGLSFIMKPVEGVLVGENENKTILKRNHADIGKVHVHIPKNCHGACG